MQNDMTDPIIYREIETKTETGQSSAETQSQPTSSDQGGGLTTPLSPMITNEQSQTFVIITETEVIDQKSNLLLPKGLAAYNSGDTTYIEYVNAELSPTPIITEEQQGIMKEGFWGLFLGFGLIFGFFFFCIFLVHILGFRGQK